jgi:hypothetical protein
MVLIGAQNPSDAATKIGTYLSEGGRARALTVVRTEVGRAYSAAAQARMEQSADVIPGLSKQWRKSGKLKPRQTHAIADGQIRKVKEPFLVGGEKLMHPRDPKASAKNTVNCGCTSLPFMANWEVQHPVDRPFTPQELSASESNRQVQELREMGFRKWVRALGAGKLDAQGNVETAGQISQTVLDALKTRGLVPVTREIGLSDRRVKHMLRDAKKSGLPAGEIARLPMYLDKPKAVFLERRGDQTTLLYTFDLPGTDRVAKVPVTLRATDKGAKVRRHNFIKTATAVPATELRKFERLMGDL